MMYVYKYVYGHIYAEPIIKLECDNRKVDTRSNGLKVTYPAARTVFGLQQFSHRCAGKWNSLPKEVVCSHSISSFKTALENYNRKMIPVQIDDLGLK